jgi:hypothetical protein
MPFKCDYCPSKFSHKSGKIRHMKNVCNNRPGHSISSQTNLVGNEPEKIVEPIKFTDNIDQSNLIDTINKLCERMDRIESKILTAEKQTILINLKNGNICIF